MSVDHEPGLNDLGLLPVQTELCRIAQVVLSGSGTRLEREQFIDLCEEVAEIQFFRDFGETPAWRESIEFASKFERGLRAGFAWAQTEQMRGSIDG